MAADQTRDNQQYPPRPNHKRPPNPCPCCYLAPEIPQLRMTPLRELVARVRAMETAVLGSERHGDAGGYIVCVDGHPIARVASLKQVTAHRPEPHEFDFEPDLPVRALTGLLLETQAQVRRVLAHTIGEPGVRVGRGEMLEGGIDNWPRPDYD